MARLQEMGEFVRSASSTIEAPVVRRLKEEFSAQAPKAAQARKPRPAAEPSEGAPGAAVPDAAADGQNGGRKVARPAPGRPQAPVPGAPGAGAGRPVISPQATGPASATATDRPAAASPATPSPAVPSPAVPAPAAPTPAPAGPGPPRPAPARPAAP